MSNEYKVLEILDQIQKDISDMKQGQVKLEQGQTKLEQGQVKLEQGQAKLKQEIKDIKADIKGIKNEVHFLASLRRRTQRYWNVRRPDFPFEAFQVIKLPQGSFLLQ